MNMLWDLFKKESLLKQSLTEIDEMFGKNEEIFKAATDYLLLGQKSELDIKKEDRKLNMFEIRIRKKILEHLLINPKNNLTLSLIVVEVARDVERVGDFSKNLNEVAEEVAGMERESAYWKEVEQMRNYIQDLIREVHQAFRNCDQKLAMEVIKGYREEIYEKANGITQEVMRNNKLSNQEAVALALALRFFKRITVHLVNIATSVVNEFPQIRYTKSKMDV